MATKTDISYGIIPLRKGELGWEVFLINQYSRIGDNTYWTLPKGHPEAGESPQESALRELKEETGLTPEHLIDAPTFSTEYSFEYNGDRINKTATFFIGIVTEDTVVLDSVEVKDAGWFELEEAHDRIYHQDSKRLFKDACAFMERGG